MNLPDKFSINYLMMTIECKDRLRRIDVLLSSKYQFVDFALKSPIATNKNGFSKVSKFSSKLLVNFSNSFVTGLVIYK